MRKRERGEEKPPENTYGEGSGVVAELLADGVAMATWRGNSITQPGVGLRPAGALDSLLSSFLPNRFPSLRCGLPQPRTGWYPLQAAGAISSGGNV